ncbi:nuclear pore complex protein NUP98B [Lactuca sativa]|uniref:Peptidase S59 domain-containing protein n=1 Tax=Lactuca sativa TaxID=4236 RepID=A0A9R1UIQ5_LACSA|nr:nuclear pore complex protein NUP98B [Lactuca sativa]KAJ0187740.1 hypothetical protein LSAT_V11C900489510 [Lactuca sativa]
MEATRSLTPKYHVYKHSCYLSTSFEKSRTSKRYLIQLRFDSEHDSNMFTSPAYSHSSSGTFGFPLVFGEGNQKVDATGMSNYGGTSTWTYAQTSSPSSSTTIFGASSPYGFGSSSSSGANATRSTFDLQKSPFGGQDRGSRIANYKTTLETEYNPEKLVSISAMPVYKAKSHEELRWEDYKFTEKGGFGPSSTAIKSTSSTLSPFTSSSFTNFSTNSWGTTSVSSTPITPNPFSKRSNSVATETPTWSWKFPGPTSTPQPLHFLSSTNNSLSSFTSSPLNSFNPFLSKTNLTSPASFTSTFAPLNQNPFTSLPTQMSSSSFSSPTFAPFIKPSSSSGFFPTPIVTSPANSMSSGLCSTFNQPTTLFPSSSSTSVSWSHEPLNQNLLKNPFTSQPTQTCSTSAAFTHGVVTMVTTPATSVSVSPFNQPTTFFKPCAPSTQNYNGENTTGIISQITSKNQNPFGTLPPISHLSFECSQSIQYGISSIPVKDKSAMVKYPLLTPRHLYRRNKLPVQKYDPKLNSLKMPFFSDTKEIPVAAFFPRENPRELVIKGNMHKQKLSDNTYENEKDDIKVYDSSNDQTKEKKKFPSVLDVPLKLQLPDYYTKPEISELESKERAEPGFCSHVNDFVIGRHGYGSIKFLGETDVRRLDLESFVQFNNREVIVYMDDTKKPPIGQGLNKPAEITLLNIKCIDKRSGVEYKDGLKIDKYIEMLKKKVVAQGGEFISYDPVEGEWKFRVQHF